LPISPCGPPVRAALATRLPLGQDPLTLSRTDVANDFHAPYTQQYSFGIQRQFGNSTVLEARYVGTHSVGQFQTVNGNPFIGPLIRDFKQFVPPGTSAGPNGRVDSSGLPNESFLTSRINGASSTYNALQIRFDTRLKNQLVLG